MGWTDLRIPDARAKLLDPLRKSTENMWKVDVEENGTHIPRTLFEPLAVTSTALSPVLKKGVIVVDVLFEEFSVVQCAIPEIRL